MKLLKKSYLPNIFLFSIVLVIFCEKLLSQNFGNQWIDYSKTYYKFNVDKTGLYRISYETLLLAGINPAGQDLKLYTRGAQIPIYTTNNGSLQPGDYIEFFGMKNDGSFDTQLYSQPSHQCNENVSLFSDIVGYYLMVDGAGEHLRFNNADNNVTGLSNPEPYFIYTSLKNTTNVHNPGIPITDVGSDAIWMANFELGEGFVGPDIQQGTPYNMVIPTNSIYTGAAIPATLKVKIVGKNDSYIAVSDQNYSISVGSNTCVNNISSSYAVVMNECELPINNLNPGNTSVLVQAFDGSQMIGNESYNYHSRIATIYGSITYPHSFDFENKTIFNFDLLINTDKYFEITNFVGGNAPIIYDLTANKRITPVIQNNVYKFKIAYDPTINATHKLVIANTDSSPSLTNVNSLTERNFVNYGLAANQGEMIIITNSVLRTGATDWVAQYKAYRQSNSVTQTPDSPETNNANSPVSSFNKVVLVDIDELYDQYAFGIPKNPMAIKNFINAALNNQSPQEWEVEPTHCFIIGKSIRYPSFRYNPNYYTQCLVPTFGMQPSDNILMSSDIFSYKPQIAIGRLPATNPDEVRIYLDKVIEYENAFTQAELHCDIEHRRWMKNALFINKGWDNEELDYLSNFSEVYADYAQSAPGGMTIVNTLNDNCSHCSFPSPLLPGYIEDGLAFINYNGHSTGLYWQYDIEEPAAYNNEGKYPFILSNSCFVGQIHETSNDQMSIEYVLAEERGAIAFLATLFLAYPAYLDIFSEALTHNLFIDYYGETIGSSIVETIDEIYEPNNPGVETTCLEFTYTGDPAIRLYHFDEPEFLLDSDEGVLLSPSEVVPGINENININFNVYNTGALVDDNLEINISILSPQGNEVYNQNFTIEAPDYLHAMSVAVPVQSSWYAGSYTVVVELDPNNLIVEDCSETSNNQFSNNFYINNNSCAAVIATNIASEYCINSPAQTLTSEITGTFSYDGQVITQLIPQSFGPGTHSIDFEFEDPNSSANCNTEFVFEVNSLPLVGFSPLSGTYCANSPISFDLGANYNPAHNYSWMITPNTGITINNSNSQNVLISFLSPGSKQIVLQVTDENGCTNLSTTATIQITEGIESPVITGDSNTCPGVELTYSIPDNSLSSVVWTVENGEIISQDNSQVVISWTSNPLNSGTVYYSGINSSGCAATNTLIVVVDTFTPEALFQITDLNICSNDLIPLINLTSAEVTSFNWILTNTITNESITSNGENPEFPVLTPGLYQLNLVAYGCSSQVFNEYAYPELINVNYDIPTIELITVEPTMGQEITLSCNYSVGEFAWEGNGLVNNGSSTVQAIPNELINVYTLTYTNPDGCVTTGQITVDFTTGIASLQNEISIHNILMMDANSPNQYWNLSWLSAYPKHKVELYNLNGSLVYTSSDYRNQFNGMINGKPLPMGNYIYRITYGDEMINNHSGLLTLLR